MKKLFTKFLFPLVLMFFTVNFVSANSNWAFEDTFESYSLGNLNGQGGWVVTNHSGNSNGIANVSTTYPDGDTKYVEMIHDGFITAVHDITPLNSGIFQLRMRHNKKGLFYFNALTSDASSQMLFSIKFTESKGIILEEADQQISLLSDYDADKWYLFTINFDQKIGEAGTFKIKIDDGIYKEYTYDNPESTVFDFAHMVFGSDSTGEMAMSGFSDIKPIPQNIELVTEEIIQEDTAITSIKSDLIDGQIVTAPIDGVLISETITETTTPSSFSSNSLPDMTANVIEALPSLSENINTNGTTTTTF